MSSFIENKGDIRADLLVVNRPKAVESKHFLVTRPVSMIQRSSVGERLNILFACPLHLVPVLIANTVVNPPQLDIGKNLRDRVH